MKKSTSWAGTFLLALAWAPFAVAHHSQVVNYDVDTEIVHRDVTVLEWVFSNPHAQLVYEAPDADGDTTQWSAHTQNLTSLRRYGYTADSFKPGQILSIKGNPGRNGRPVMSIEEVILEDGTAFRFNAPAPAVLSASTAESVEETKRHLTGIWGFWGFNSPLPPEDRAQAPKDAVLVDAYGQAPDLPIGESGNYPLTEKGREFLANWAENDDECRPPSAWLGMTAPFMVQFDEPQYGRLHIRYEYQDQERTVWLDGRGHPPLNLYPRTLQGHSIGHWEGDTLVIETVNMLSNQITLNGIYHSDKAVLREWISREGDTLIVVRVLEDPEFLSEPIAEVVKRRFMPDGELLPYGPCIPVQGDY